MKYEIPREMFKQRLEDRLNFVMIDLVAEDKSPAKFENIVHINYSSNFKNEFAAQYPNKNQNVVVYSLNKGDEAPAQAAEDLKALGYNFVYFYNGTADDAVLDKGLN
jgi:rhodanese-related sulfurtransferase